jgi:hypothetical protein
MAREIFAKMSGTLDGNRKIRKAGRNGREVFLWVMRQVAIRDSDGVIPLGDVTDFAYVADQLMCSEEEAREGFEAAVTASLLSVTGDSCSIVGWDDDWSRRAQSNGERQAKFREKRKASAESRAVVEKSVTEAPLQVTANVTSNVVEESRGEESRSVSREPDATRPANGNGFGLEHPKPPKPPRATRTPKHPIPADYRPDASVVAEAQAAGVDLDREMAKLRDWATGKAERKADWHATARNWIRSAAERRSGPVDRRQGPATPPMRRKFL